MLYNRELRPKHVMLWAETKNCMNQLWRVTDRPSEYDAVACGWLYEARQHGEGGGLAGTVVAK